MLLPIVLLLFCCSFLIGQLHKHAKTSIGFSHFPAPLLTLSNVVKMDIFAPFPTLVHARNARVFSCCRGRRSRCVFITA
uniref:Putative secreted protein n=1 Tax=Anopheles darlingi TaxID=43151 RepID=A0A2M4DAB0_ANODA